MLFYNRTNPRKVEPAPAGSKEEIEYTVYLNERGEKCIKETGRTNIYEMIQEQLEESKVENIVRRATLGDVNALNANHGTYMDVTDMPTTLAQAQQFVINATREFNKLPIEKRRMFNMSAEQYVAAYGNEYWMRSMGLKENNEQRNREPLRDATGSGDSEK